MSSSRKSRHASKRHHAPALARVACRTLIRLDTERIRRAEYKALQREQKAYGKVEQEWNRFEQEDKPAYARWLRLRCGPLFDSLHNLNQELDLLRHTLDLINDFKRYYRHRPMHKCAEAAVQYFAQEGKPPAGFEDFFKQRDSSISNQSDADEDDDDDDPFDDDDEEFADEDIFESFADVLPENEYDDFKTFLSDMFDLRFRPSQPPLKIAERVKALYRKIARRLHPDHGGSAQGSQLELWHEAQRAYEQHDLGTLERIYAHCDLLDTESAQSAPVASIRNNLAFFRNAAAALRKRIRDARRSIEWGFLTWTECRKQKHLAEAQRQLQVELSAQKRMRENIKSLIERYRRIPTPRKRKTPAPPNPRQRNLFDLL